jgi:hypothetical protein
MKAECFLLVWSAIRFDDDVVIGPVGWATLGLFTIVKFGRPNYRKLFPAIISIATARAAQDAGALPKQVAAPKLSPPVPEKVSGQEHRPTPNAVESTESSTPNRLIRPMQGERPDSVDYAASPVISQLQRELADATRRKQDESRRAAKSMTTDRMMCSKQEKTIFDFKKTDLAACTRKLIPGTHYLDLPHEQRALVDELFEQQQLMEEEDSREKQRKVAACGRNRISASKPTSAYLRPQTFPTHGTDVLFLLTLFAPT